jgi:hypothetical protein
MPRKLPPTAIPHWRPLDDVLPDRPDRNYEKVEKGDLRIQIEPAFNALHDDLTEAYYQHWKKGESAPWFGYDVQATPEESKALFDSLHGLIFNHLEAQMARAEGEDASEAVAAIHERRKKGVDIKGALAAISALAEID